MEENKEESLCEAARNGDGGRIKSLIAAGADVTYFDGVGQTPLMHAAKNGCPEVVKALLDSGAPWNALSPSNLSAGDFAMENGHQSAFDILLNAGIQAELILGTIARKDNAKGNSNGEYLEDRVTFSEDKVMDTESKAVMMAWERPLMEAHAKAICSGGGHILNIGFGMGLVDTAIQQYTPVSHTIVEAHPEVYARMIQTGWGDKENVKIIFGRWQDVLSQLETYALVTLELENLGYSTQLIPLPVKDCLGEETWEGVKHKYWQLDTYYLPVCQPIDDSE
ncbi:hypothetical protein DH2020_004009 [Rehmannia glutinosa]|uniref:Protein arginine N-methyltransferase 2 n=1 Tax=Rehmannia glutinosa TaxID=99300 RepID=A0ABR0XNC6_REHGL